MKKELVEISSMFNIWVGKQLSQKLIHILTEIYLEELGGKKEKENKEEEIEKDEEGKDEFEEEDIFGNIPLTPEEESKKIAEAEKLHCELLPLYWTATPH